MAKTVIGLFDNRTGAQSTVQELLSSGFTRDAISVMSKKLEAQDSEVEYVEEDGQEQIEDMAKGAGKGAAIGGAAGLLLGLSALAIPGIGLVLAAGPLAALIAGAGIGATTGGLISGLTRLGLNEQDADTYAEGIRRGGTLISVQAADETADRAIGIMKNHGAIEINKRAAEWSQEGWSGFDSSDSSSRTTGTQGAANRIETVGEVAAEHELGMPNKSVGTGAGEVAIPVVEEQLQVGKREVERGGVRVQSHVTETPVEEEVQLREEHVRVERVPVDYTFHGTESEAFKQAFIEISESREELVVSKKARVVEEVVVGKDVEQRTEVVRDTLRRTDVEVEQLEPGRTRTATASSNDTDPQGS